MKNVLTDMINEVAESKAKKRKKRIIIAIAIPLILIWAFILFLLVTYIRACAMLMPYTTPAQKIEIGDSTSQVTKILGEPDEKSNYVWQYYGGEYKKLLDKQEKLLNKLETTDDGDEVEKIFNEVTEIEEKMATLEFPYTSVWFDGNQKVMMVLHDAQRTANQLDFNKSLSSYEIFPKYLSALSNPTLIKFTAKEIYYDGSYYCGSVTPDTTNINTFKSGNYSVSWKSYFRNDNYKNCSKTIEVNNTVTAGTEISGEVGWNVFKAKIEKECTLDNLQLDITITNDYSALTYDSETNTYWAKVRPYITSVTIANGVKSIGSEVFKDCTSMTKVTIPESVTKIDESAFDGCKTLESFNVATDNPTYASQDGILYNKDKTEFILIPQAITSISIPDSITSIDNYIFRGCSLLTKISIPDSVTSIGGTAFYGCNSLTSITVGEDNEKYKSENNCILTKDGSTLVVGCKNSVIPDGVTSIGNEAFSGCSSLTSITIPDGVTSIGNEAFSGCSSLTCITIPDSVTRIGALAFDDCSALAGVYITNITTWCNISFERLLYNYYNSNPLYLAHYLYLNNNLVTDLVIPNNVTSITDNAFVGCTSLTNITIPDSVTSIGYEAFCECDALESITFKGTKAGWNSIKKGFTWNYGTADYTIHCTDGKLDKDGNEIE